MSTILDILEILEQSLFFTGAGFSKPAGCKLSSEMLTDLKNRSIDENDKLFTKTEKDTIKFILSCLEYQAQWRTLENNGKYKYLPNIEEFAQLLRRIKNREYLLPYPITGSWSDKITVFEQKFEMEREKQELALYTSIENKIKTKCYNEWLSFNNTNFLKPLYDLIKNILANSNLKLEIFTLNNDTVLEDYFQDENAVYTGFVSNKWVGFDKDNIGENTYNASRINYYKLHGSIDWIRLTDGTVRKKYNDGQIEEDEIEIDPFLIFGHGSKIYTVEPFFSLLETFKYKLKEKKYFFVVGYSFFDPHINNLFFNELQNSIDQNKLLIIVNPKIVDGLGDNCFEDINDIKDKKDKKVLKKECKSVLVDFFSSIQKDPLYTEVPDFNLTKISHDSFEYIKYSGEDFLYDLYNGRISNFINQVEKNKKNIAELF